MCIFCYFRLIICSDCLNFASRKETATRFGNAVARRVAQVVAVLVLQLVVPNQQVAHAERRTLRLALVVIDGVLAVGVLDDVKHP